MTSYKMQNLVYEWVGFSKFSQSWVKISSNLRKWWKIIVILLKIWPKLEQIGIWMGHFFLKKWYLGGSTFKFCSGTFLPKPKLSTTPSQVKHICNFTVIPLLSCIYLCFTSFFFFFVFKLKRKQFDRANLNDLAFRKH